MALYQIYRTRSCKALSLSPVVQPPNTCLQDLEIPMHSHIEVVSLDGKCTSKLTTLVYAPLSALVYVNKIKPCICRQYTHFAA